MRVESGCVTRRVLGGFVEPPEGDRVVGVLEPLELVGLTRGHRPAL